MFLTSFCVAYVGILPNFMVFLFRPLVISSQLVEEFHNKVECWQEVMVDQGNVGTTTFDGSTTIIPSSIY
jgi:hypothetical protein